MRTPTGRETLGGISPKPLFSASAAVLGNIHQITEIFEIDHTPTVPLPSPARSRHIVPRSRNVARRVDCLWVKNDVMKVCILLLTCERTAPQLSLLRVSKTILSPIVHVQNVQDRSSVCTHRGLLLRFCFIPYMRSTSFLGASLHLSGIVLPVYYWGKV